MTDDQRATIKTMLNAGKPQARVGEDDGAELLAVCKALLKGHRARDQYAIVGRDSDGHPLNAMGVACQRADAIIAKIEGAKTEDGGEE